MSGVFAAIFVCDASYADEAAATTGAPAPTTVQSTTMTTSAEPAPATYVPTSPEEGPSSPPAKSCGLINHSCRGAHLSLALEGGASSFNESSPFSLSTGTGSVSKPGPSWGLRVGVELTKWLGVDAHYIGMNNHAYGAATPNGSVSLLTSGFTGEVRLTAPLPYVQPYLLTGAGVYTTSVTGSDNAQAATPLTGSTEFGVPIGLGLSIPITNGVSVGAELAYHRFFGESFSANEEFGGGDLTTMNAVVRGRL